MSRFVLCSVAAVSASCPFPAYGCPLIRLALFVRYPLSARLVPEFPLSVLCIPPRPVPRFSLAVPPGRGGVLPERNDVLPG